MIFHFALIGLVVAASPSANLRIRAAGDVMLGTTVPEGHLAPEDGANLLSDVRPLLEDADLTFVNLEGPLCDNGETTKCRRTGNCFAFRMPTRYGKYLQEAGIDLVSTANNHSGDFGDVCRRQTEATLDRLGIGWSGPPGTVATIERNGLKIALVAFHASQSCNYINDHDAAAKLVEVAKASHSLVIVSFHGGAEGAAATHVKQGPELFHGENRGDLRVFTHRMIDAGADLVLGHGPHVLRALETYRGKLIAYSLGNFATYGRFDVSGALGIGMVLEAELTADGRFVRGHIFSTRQEGEGVPRVDSENRAVELVRRLTSGDFPKTGAAIEPNGDVFVSVEASE